jgi:hypothetical protein
MEIPVKNDTTRIKEAAAFIVEIIHPTELYRNKSERDVQKSVLEAIRNAYKQGVFGKAFYALNNQVDARDFFTWTCGQKNWQALKSVVGLPYVVKSAASMVTTLDGSPFGHIPSKTFEESERRCIKAQKELAASAQQGQALKAEVAEYRRQQENWSVVNSKNERKKPRRL